MGAVAAATGGAILFFAVEWVIPEIVPDEAPVGVESVAAESVAVESETFEALAAGVVAVAADLKTARAAPVGVCP